VVREKIHSGRVVLEDIRKRADSYIGILQHKVIDDYVTPATYDWHVLHSKRCGKETHGSWCFSPAGHHCNAKMRNVAFLIGI
jgi:hypothetical protein